jgi:hypothetical protein
MHTSSAYRKFKMADKSPILVVQPKLEGRGYFAGLRVTKRNKATVLLTLTLFQTPTLTPNPNPYPNPNPNLTLRQVCF